MTEPQISILMTAYNAERFLRETIESILRQQTVRSWELLFVDDGSTDGTLGIAAEYAFHFPRTIRVLRHPAGVNRGISASRNLALRHALGAYAAFLDSDDVWLPHCLETMAALLERTPQAQMVYAGAERWVDFSEAFDEAKARRATWGSNYLPPLVPEGEATGMLPRGRLLEWFLSDESLVPCICAVMVRTEAARAVGGFCEDFEGLYDDQAFHAKMATQYDVYAHDACVARYRQHAASCCGVARQSKEDAERERTRFGRFLESQLSAVEAS